MYSIYNIIRCIAVATMLVVSTAAVQAQQKKKTPLQKRENYEFTFDLPRYVE